ncbi:substrate-binding periplasmic protein [Vogesella sp. GCM10023246]|uniref:Transporter substrate-binding domain-containing protein n=1 Tax=Vogesella oryzagri TaxID=3160864 RepID=A0ABV1M2U3_9NEIS
MGARYALLMMALLAPWVVAKPPLLQVGYFYLPPHGYTQHGEPAGFALQYFNRIAAEMGVVAQYRQEPLSRLRRNTQLDMVLYLAASPERARRLHFAARPLLEMQGVLVVSQQSALRQITDPAQLATLRIGIWADGYLSPMLAAVRQQLEPMSGDDVIERSLQKVDLQRIDAFYSPEPYAVRYVLQRMGMPQRFRLLNLPEKPVGLYPAFTSRGLTYQARFERAAESVRKQQPYAVLLQQMLPVTPEGG